VRYIAIFENPLLLYHFPAVLPGGEKVWLVLKERFALPQGVHKNIKIVRGDLYKSDTYRKLKIDADARVLLQVDKKDNLEKVLHLILNLCDTVPIVVITPTSKEIPSFHQTNISFLHTNDLLQHDINKEWLHISNRQRTHKLRELTEKAEHILILTQHDPDPDALASGLALRALLGRNRSTAPIGSFGKVTRSENVSMVRLLDIHYATINQQSLSKYSMLAMVDVQPPYFGDYVLKTDIVFDHHPHVAPYRCSFKDVRVKYGATASILTEYLLSNDIKINQRLATALLYGIKTDTLLLEREVSPADINAFAYLYPLANHNLIRKMEHPSFNPDEVHSFITVLRKQKLIDNILFAHLGLLKQEDIIPRLADFCLQVAGADWSVVSGLFQRNLVISVRNVGYVRHAGELVKKIFHDNSIAGGHRTMAKVVIPLKDFKEAFHVVKNSDIEDTIVELFKDVIREKVS
jgi:nanoRNase/pAp phosphatase (c-di-AMP/oligoRNAs hydrolase)